MSQNWLLKPLTRRQMLGVGGLTSLGAVVGGVWSVNLYTSAFFNKLIVKDISFKSARWPKSYKDLKIAFLTDLHVGCMSVGLGDVKKIVAQVNALNADIILLGGDYLTHAGAKKYSEYISPRAIAAAIAPLHAPLGVYSVLGNHDWGNDGIGMLNALEKNNIKMLENNAVFVPHGNAGFWVVGVADYLTRVPDYKKAMAAANSDHPKIVLSHDPYTFKDITGEPVIQLSGHTHGGQVKLPFIGPVVNPTPGAPLRWLYGLIEENNQTMLISSGVGTSVLPIKNTPCEVVVLTLSSGLESAA